jgi:Cu+-exporting ATPase
MSKHVQTTSVAELDPVCGMTVNPSTAKGQVDHAGKTYYFCSSNCVKKFRQDPSKYIAKLRASAEPSLVNLGIAKPSTAAKLSTPGTTARQKDPVCGMDVDEKTAKITSSYKGQTYYFCSPGCKKSFDTDPEKYLGNKLLQRRNTDSK